jgi:succinate dehydrogenase / fumarate reductase flavoprotein subunit
VEKRKFDAALVNPANRRKLSVIIVGTGLAGGAAAPRSARPATT